LTIANTAPIIQSSQTSPNRNNHSEAAPTIQLPNIDRLLKHILHQPKVTTVFSAPVLTNQQQPLQL
jgi:hypothetical protein